MAAPSINWSAWLLQAEPITLVADDRPFLDRLRVEAPDPGESVAVAMPFADPVRRRRRSGESLEAWFATAAEAPLAKFAAGFERDRGASRGAITTP